MKASDLLVRCLEAEGVDTIFGIPGEENIDVMDSLSRSSIRFVLTRHEQAAAFMADAHGRITGKPGVCLATLGPGAANLVTGVANAHLDRSPLVALTGQAESTRLHKESHQNVNTLELFRGITKYDQAVLSASTIPEIVRKAFDMATMESPGAVHLQLPEDVAKEDVLAEPLPIGKQAAACPDEGAIAEAARMIKEAERPVVLCGNGVVRQRAYAELRKLIEAGNLPLVNTFMAKGVLPFDHPRNLFTVGGKPYPEGLRPLHEADLVVAAGFDLVEYDPVVWNRDRTRRVINLHSIQAETDAHYPVAIDLVGDLPFTLSALAAKLERRPDPAGHDRIRERRLQELLSVPVPEEELPRRIMRTLSETLPPGSIVISDVGLHKVWVSRWYQPKAPGTTIIYNGLASMGASLPAAIACRLAEPDVPIVVVSGDGGFLMNSQELETARRLGAGFAIVLFNDRRYRLIEQHQRDNKLAVTQIAFANPDFSLYARSFGVGHRLAGDAETFASALREAVSGRELTLIEVPM